MFSLCCGCSIYQLSELLEACDGHLATSDSLREDLGSNRPDLAGVGVGWRGEGRKKKKKIKQICQAWLLPLADLAHHVPFDPDPCE